MGAFARPAEQRSTASPGTRVSRAPRSATAYSRRYNIRVSDPKSPDDSRKHRRHAVYASETTGLLLIALMLLVLTLVRYWHEIHWSLR